MSVEINPPFRVFTDVDGEPLEDGYIHIGAVNQNPQAVPVQVFWDEPLTIPAAQPIRTLGGYPARSGTPSRMYVAADEYSISVSNKNGTLIYSDLNNRSGDAGIRQDLANNTDISKGSAIVGHRTAAGDETTVRAELLDNDVRITNAEASISTLNADVAELGSELNSIPAGFAQLSRASKNVTTSLLGASPINILGDSISHGAFALNLFSNGWVNIFKRMTNAEFDISGGGGLGDSSSYGFVSWLNIGTGPTLSTEIHDANAAFLGWSVLTNATVPDSLSGAQVRSTASGSVIDFSVPSFMATMRLFYTQQPGGGTFEVVRVTTAGAEVVITTVNTDGALDNYRSVSVPITDNGIGTFRYRVKSTTAGQIDMAAGASYLASVERSVVNNFSNSGRRLAEVSESVIQECIRGAQLFVCSLSHNDAADAESTPAYFADYQQRIDWIIQYANLYQVPVVFADFCWTFPAANKARVEMRRIIDECNGLVVDFPGHFTIDGIAPTDAELITTLGLFVDASHPNVAGHQIVAEVMAKALRLSVSSKRHALEQFDWWMPLALDAAANVINTNTTHRLLSAVKRSGAGVMVRVRIRESAGANPFPNGVRNIQASWPTKYAITGQQTQTVSSGIDYLTATGALATHCQVTAGGQVRINQIAANVQDIIGSLTGPSF